MSDDFDNRLAALENEISRITDRARRFDRVAADRADKEAGAQMTAAELERNTIWRIEIARARGERLFSGSGVPPHFRIGPSIPFKV